MHFTHDFAWKNFEIYREIYTNSIKHRKEFFEFHDKMLMKDKINNACFYCIDRHLNDLSDKIAIIWYGDKHEDRTTITYRELHNMVCGIAKALIDNDVGIGDVVTIYCSTNPASVAAMLACARIGAVHNVVFGGFSANALSTRVQHSNSKIIITQKSYSRGGKNIDLAGIAKQVQRNNILFLEDIDRIDNFTLSNVSSNSKLFDLYTSGTTGDPKPISHFVRDYLLYIAMTFKYIFDVRQDDVMFCTSDIGWITGHSYMVYAPLFFGITTIIFSGSPTYPDATRYWKIIEQERATIFYTSPTALRSLAVFGSHIPKSFDLSSLRILGSVGEPLDEVTKTWYSTYVGNNRLPILDTWWQTEIGGVAIAPLLGKDSKLGGVPFFGRKAEVTNGQLVINGRNTGDLAVCNDGYIKVLGRADDILNISGHRISAVEIEHAILSIPCVKECCVIGHKHDIKGEGASAFVVAEFSSIEQFVGMVLRVVREKIGGIAIPDEIIFTTGLPKNRSGKYVKSILRKLLNNEAVTECDKNVLIDDSIVEELNRDIDKNRVVCSNICYIKE